MIVALFGTDTYRRGEQVRAILAEYEKKHSRFTVRAFDFGEEGAALRLADFIENQSLFDPYKLAVVSGISLEEALSSILSEVAGSKKTTLVIVSDKPLKTLPDNAVVRIFDSPTGAERVVFVRREALRRGVSVSSEEARMIAEAFPDTWGIVTELDARALGARTAARPRVPDFFPLLGQLRQASLSPRLGALAALLRYEDPGKAFNVLAALLSPEEKERMADYDAAVKSGKIEYAEALLDFALAQRR